MEMYWDRDGVPIEDALEWSKLYQDWDYRLLAQSNVPHRIVTVWVGLDQGVNPDASPLIFSTAVFDGDQMIDEIFYPTQDKAYEGHFAAVRKYGYG